MSSELPAIYASWMWMRAALHRGWWLVTSVYLVVDAHLSPSQLVLIGVAQGATALVFEVPAGVVADTISRKWSLVVSHLLMGTAMIATGLVTDFGLILATQMLWGLSWTFASGADVAWITDELDQPALIPGVLMRAGRAELVGSAAGIIAIGALGSVLERSTAMVLAGAAMLLLCLFVVARFREVQFVSTPTARWATSWSVLARGMRLARSSRAILVMFAATLLLNGAEVAAGRLQPRRLVDLGLPTDPVAWLTVLGVLTLLVGAAVFRIVEPHVEGARAALRGYGLACAAGTVGLIALALAPEELSASAAVLVFAGIAVPLTRTLGTIWVNHHTTSDVRATVHSLLAQAEYVGEIVGGLAFAAVATAAGLPIVFLACAGVFAVTIVVIRSLRDGS
jgi:MFS family permease